MLRPVIRETRAGDREPWSRLYADYARFYQVEQTDAMRDRVWSWINDPAHEVRCLVAQRENRLVGLAHFRAFARPLSATVAGFLDDLYVDPAARGGGIAQALIGAVVDEGRAQGWSVVRWLTAEDNYRARSAYDKLAAQTRWRVYDIGL